MDTIHQIEHGRRALVPASVLGALVAVAFAIVAARSQRDALWPYIGISIGIVMVIASLFSLAVLDAGPRPRERS